MYRTCEHKGSRKLKDLKYTVKALYFMVFPMNTSLLEFNFADFEFVTLLQYTPKRSHGILILRATVHL